MRFFVKKKTAYEMRISDWSSDVCSSDLESIKIDPSPEMRKELVKWIKYCGSLNKHAIEAVSPGTSGKGPEDYEIEDIMKYQKITEDEMDERSEERRVEKECVSPCRSQCSPYH